MCLLGVCGRHALLAVPLAQSLGFVRNKNVVENFFFSVFPLGFVPHALGCTDIGFSSLSLSPPLPSLPPSSLPLGPRFLLPISLPFPLLPCRRPRPNRFQELRLGPARGEAGTPHPIAVVARVFFPLLRVLRERRPREHVVPTQPDTTLLIWSILDHLILMNKLIVGPLSEYLRGVVVVGHSCSVIIYSIHGYVIVFIEISQGR